MTSTTVDFSTTAKDGGSAYTNAMVYGYGTAAVAIISSLSLLGILIFPALKNRSHEYVLQFFIALGVGTMSADAFIHIIPDVLGLHDHSDSAHADPDAEAEEAIVVWKMSVVFMGVYLFFIMENALKVWRRHRVNQEFIEGSELPVIVESTDFTGNQGETFQNKSAVADNEIIDDAKDIDSMSTTTKGEDTVFLGFNTVVLTVLIGDAMHNVADGMAIGVSFSESAAIGIGTSIAIMFHEIPHELGDFAIFINNGASKWQAVLLNVVAAFTAFIGLYIGIALSQDENVRTWILAVVAGTFLYVALVQVMGEMTNHSCADPRLQFLLQNIGLLLGWTMMLLLGLYEEAIQESFA